MAWTVFLRGLSGETYSFNLQEQAEVIKVKKFKKLVKTRTGIKTKQQRLLYAGQQMEDDKTLATYNIRHGSTVFLVLRLDGGSARRPLPEGIPHVNEDCLRCNERPSLRMPCQHTYCSTCLYTYVEIQVTDNDKRKSTICCPICQTQWSLQTIQDYTGASDEEIEALATKMTENTFERDDIIQCPGCNSYCQREDKSKKRVRCVACQLSKKSTDFCWICRNEWKNDRSHTSCDITSSRLGSINCSSTV